MPELWAALAIVMILEGALPFVAPRLWRETFIKLVGLSDGQIRFIGLIAILLGIVALLLVRDA
ncbi:MAG: DUF2065 domain-containing protein [Thermoanaerobaculia bacterium]